MHTIGERESLFRLTAERRLVALWAAALAAAWLLLFAPLAHAARTTFDHNTTGYELIGEHRSAPCDGCHVGGIFKGTPTDCFACHSAGSRFGATAKPTTHMVSDNNCAECHTPFSWQPAAMFNHTNVLGTCNSCHNGVQASGKPAGHVPTTAECSLCHVVTLPWNSVYFAHTGITDNCASCHDNVRAPGKPPTHLPSTAPCEACHSPTNFTTFANTAMNHAGITNNCQACHETGMSWYGVTMVDRPTPAQDALHPTASSPGGADCANCHSGFNVGDFNKDLLPSNHIPLAPGSRCMSCHTGPDFSVMPTLTNIHAYAPSTSANCTQCHGPTTAPTFAIPAANFSIVTTPASHVPTSAPCESCHVGAGSSITATPVVNGAKFSGSAMSHAGLTTCVSCHGPTITGASFAGITNIVVMPATSPAGPTSHIPSATSCESCHQATMPSGLVPANASKATPGTAFQTPAPTTAQIHAGVTSGCANCHEGGDLWMDVGQYPISPTALTGIATTQYLGFNTRPGKTASTFSLADAAHPTTGDCGQCHSSTNYFDGAVKPANHIPTSASAQCSNCHTTTDFSVLPTLTNIHAYAPSTSANCTQCHGPTTAPTFAIPAANFSIVTTPASHVPTSAPCESCHVGAGSSIASTPVVNGAKFSGSAMSHAGLTTCAGCHGPTVTGASFAGISSIVVMPPTAPVGPSSHIPSATSCESCHQGSMPSGLVPANAVKTAPGTAFQAPAPTTAQIHAGVTSGCTNCHENGDVWMGAGSYPISPSAVTGLATTQYLGFNTRPGKTASTFSLADAAHPTTGDCGQCHSNTNYFDGSLKPSNHIPTAASAQCTNCHTGTDFSVMPTLTNIHAYAPSTSANCTQCHGPTTAPTFAIPAANFSIATMPANHVPTSAPCESCHVGAGSSIAATPVVNGAKFSGSAMSHAGLTTCVSCHGPTITGASFVGITNIVVMPATSPAGPNSHIPSGTACESCHQATMPSGLIPASSTKTAPGTAFQTPAPTTAMIHSGVTTGCSNCHEGGDLWMDVGQYPISPTALTGIATTQYLGFNTRPGKTASTFTLADAAHPTTGDCGQCHSNTNYFDGVLKPSNHIPTSASAQCTNCHTGTDFSVMPTLTNIHAYAPSTSSNCAQCHGPTTAPTFAIPAANFSIVTTPANHVPTTAACESCHVGAGSSIAVTPVVNGAKFSGSAMSHAGLTTCAGCHGPTITGASFAGITNIVVMPATSPAGASSHIPSATNCESCHQATMPSGLVPANATKTAPGTAFQTPAPTTAQIHAGVTSGCANCHEVGDLWMDVGQYPITPTALTGVSTTQYLGFNTRPGKTASTFSLADAAHPTTGDCGQCHSSTNYFDGTLKPSNHIPTSASAQCTNCHTSTDFSVMPTLTNIHAYAPSTSANCTQCHGSTTAPTFAIPAANFSIVTTPANHVPTTAACETCHVGAGSSIAATPVVNGAKFSGSAMSHAGLTTCVGCHGPTITGASFAGITKIVVMPPTSPVGLASHIPSGTACETCHQATMPSGLVPANATATAPGTKFATPVPTTAMIHSGVTTGCVNCHESGYLWMDASKYPISPTALTGIATTQYTGFNTRPGKTASTFGLLDSGHPTTGDCGQCHGNTNYFEGVLKPSNHIPTAASAQCTNCHTGTDFSVMPTLTSIHAYAPSTSSNCTQCHGPTTAPTFAIPAANFSIVTTPANHVPTSAPCESCHVGAGSSITATPVVNGAKFSGSAMSHAGLTTCVSCHGPTITGTSFAGITRIVVMPATTPMGPGAHVPSATNCEGCHQGTMPSGLVPANATQNPPGTKFQSPAPTTAQVHAGITSGCATCHEGAYQWLDMTANYPLSPATLASGTAQYLGFQTRPGKSASSTNLADSAHPSSGDCSQCHTRTDYFEGQLKPANHIPTSATAQCTNCHTNPDFSVLPTLTSIHAYAPSTSSNCVQCHGTSQAPTFAIPAANFSIVTMPANHVPTSAACESCHVGAGSSIAATPVVNGAKFSGSAMSHAGLTTCAECHGQGIHGATFAGITSIVVMPPTAPMGPSAHILSTSDCENCHMATVPSGLVPANSTKVPPGTKFQSPAPTTAMIHSGVTSGCATCHEGANQWLDMTANYPLSPAALTGNPTTQYVGFQTRPGKAASSTNLLDGAHPTSGDCSLCHTRTDYFEGVLKPSNHIPTSATAVCTNCHTNPDFSVMPTLTNIHAYAPSTSANCTQCHGSTTAPTFAIPAANFSIVTTPANHVPTSAPCESCHVGAGSSIASTPVVNGAKFTNSAMNHAGLTTCIGCHGPTITGASFAGITKIVVMPATSPMGANAHIPSGTACESCHQATMPSGLVPANATVAAPGTKFATPAPTTAMIHSGITSGCASCHESGYLWMDASKYPISPTALSGVSTTHYTGFNTRPGKTASTYGLADAAHPATGDCGQCHGNTNYFDGVVQPSNHIPTSATAQCANCHTNPDFSVLPTLTSIHAYAPSTSANCTQCHGPTTAPTFAIPAANFSIVTTPANHVPTTAACESCHVGAGSSIASTPVVNGAKFTNSAMSHAGLTTCVGCHGPTITGASFAGITKIVVMPPISPVGMTSHIPSATACEACHAGSMPSGLMPANATKSAPGSAFATPIPTTAMIHGSISSGCSSCHDTGYLWMDMSYYPISPTAVTGLSTTQYVGFQTRPVAAASTYSVADSKHPTSGDCSQCHTGTNYFSAEAEPANHIPTLPGAQCATCHTTAGNFAVYTTNMTQLHGAVATTCSTCHADGKGPFAGATGFAIVQMSTRGVHIPITNKGLAVECSGCHKTVTAFTGTIMSHAAIGDTATSASGNACDACHELGFRNRFYGVAINFTRDSANHYICGAPGTPAAPNVTICANGGSDCLTGCHQHNNIPSQYARVKPGTPSKQIQGATTPTTAAKPPATGLLRQAIVGRTAAGRMAETFGGRVDHAALGGVACQTCHNGSAATGKAPAHPLTNNACRDCHSTMAWSPVLHVDHADVIGACATCHDGRHATGKPATHPLAGIDCDRCHTTSAWKPAAFDHKSVAPGSCATCHNGLQAPGKPATHVVTMLSCDSCHYVLGWKPVKPAAAPPTPTRKPTPRQVTPSRGRDKAPLAPPL